MDKFTVLQQVLHYWRHRCLLGGGALEESLIKLALEMQSVFVRMRVWTKQEGSTTKSSVMRVNRDSGSAVYCHGDRHCHVFQTLVIRFCVRSVETWVEVWQRTATACKALQQQGLTSSPLSTWLITDRELVIRARRLTCLLGIIFPPSVP